MARSVSATIRGTALKWLVAVLLLALGQPVYSQVEDDLPLVLSASSMRQQGFVRIINRSARGGTLTIHAIDDDGRRFGPVYLSLDENESVQFNSEDLERGNSGVGLSGGVGNGNGNWRLELESTLDIEPLAYIRTSDGFLTSMHELAAEESPLHYRIPIFNPASNLSLVSWLRLINPGSSSASITISGLDARGNAPPGGDVSLTLGAGEAREVTAQQLENGAAGLTGRFGRGQGKWQLSVSSNSAIQVMGLMETRSGHLTNLSRGVAPGRRTIPLVLPDSIPGQEGFVRIINRSDRAGSVSIEAIDDRGQSFGPVVLSLVAKGAVQFNSGDLEQGNTGIGLSWGVGNGTGNWRLELETTLDIEPLAYVRTSDGFLTSMHEVAAAEGTSMRYRVPIFNPGSNRSLVSWLRLINPGDRAAGITIDALDAKGDAPPRGRVQLTLQPGTARTLTAEQLENGASGLSGRFGQGEGKWQLFVSARTPLYVMGLMETRSWHLTNLSGTSMEPEYAGSAPVADDISLSTDATNPYIEAQLIGTDPDGDTLMYVLDGASTGPGYRDAFVVPDSGRLFAALEPGDRTRVEIPYAVTDGTRFSEQARVIVTIDQTPETELGDVPEDPFDYGAIDLDYFDTTRIPRSVDLSGSFPVPGNQGSQGSCTAWATGYALKSYQERVEEGWAFSPSTTFSPAWIYNQVKVPGPCSGPDPYDCGSRIPDALDLIVSKGAATLSTMPYDDQDYRTRPSFAAEREAARFKGLSKRRVGSVQHMKGALANRYPIVIGMPVYGSFFSLSGSGSVYNNLRGSPSAGHAVTLVGYDDSRFGGAFKVINSWGTGWGDRGYFWLPYSIYTDTRFNAYAYLLVDGPNDDRGRPPPPTPPPCGRGDNRPNLVASSWSTEYYERPGGTGTWTYEVQNTGSATAPAGVDVNLILSRDRRADVSDYWVTYEEIPFTLRPGWSAVRDGDNPLSFRFPETIPAGTYYMAMWVDDVNEVRECDETDNVAYGSNLVRFRFTLPDIAIDSWWSQWGRFTGNGELHYRVTNLGSATITNTRWDINLVLHSRIDPSDPLGRRYFLFYEDATHRLVPGGAIWRDAGNPAYFNIFEEVLFGRSVPSGTYYISLWVDDLGQIRESNEWNNVSVGRNLVTIRRSAQDGQKQSEGVKEAAAENTPKDAVWQSTFNGKVLPGQLTRKVKLVDHDDGSRQLIFLDEEPQSLPPSATVGKPKSGEQEDATSFQKSNQSDDIILFPRVDVLKMP